jgi:hypothetical protein
MKRCVCVYAICRPDSTDLWGRRIVFCRLPGNEHGQATKNDRLPHALLKSTPSASLPGGSRYGSMPADWALSSISVAGWLPGSPESSYPAFAPHRARTPATDRNRAATGWRLRSPDKTEVSGRSGSERKSGSVGPKGNLRPDTVYPRWLPTLKPRYSSSVCNHRYPEWMSGGRFPCASSDYFIYTPAALCG